VELSNYIRILRKSWILILSLALVGVAAAAGLSLVQTPQYSATSKVFVSTQSSGSVSDLAQGSNFTVQRVTTYSNLATTPIVLLPVIAELELEVDTGTLSQSIGVAAPTNTSIIEISVQNDDAVLAAAIANATAESLTDVVDRIETPATVDATSAVKLTLVQQAGVPASPISPKVPINIALGLLIGLALGVGLAVLRQVLDTRIRNERDVELVTDATVIGGIVFDAKAASRPLIVQDDPRSPRAESFRTLRTNLQFLDVGQGGRSFVVTSSIQSEGKSTTTANLAIALADSGVRVLLVDADLRRPKVASYMGLEGSVGLTDVLIGRVALSDVVQEWGRGRLSVLPAGTVPPNPSELLGSAAMGRLVIELRSSYDVVLFDTPPLLPVTDAAILSRFVGGVILVVAAGHANRHHVGGAISALANVGSSVSGIVLTMLPTKGPDAYGYGRYGYGYEYGEEISAKATTKRSKRTQDAKLAKVRSRS
jgi:capsular exopolysaccharide synthesis family protein